MECRYNAQPYISSISTTAGADYLTGRQFTRTMCFTTAIATTFVRAADALTMLSGDLLRDRKSFLIFPASALGPGERFHVIDTTSAGDPETETPVVGLRTIQSRNTDSKASNESRHRT